MNAGPGDKSVPDSSQNEFGINLPSHDQAPSTQGLVVDELLPADIDIEHIVVNGTL